MFYPTKSLDNLPNKDAVIQNIQNLRHIELQDSTNSSAAGAGEKSMLRNN